MRTADKNTNRWLLPRIARGVARNALADRYALRGVLIRDVWAVAKRFGATGIRDIYPNEVPGLRDQVVTAPVDETNRAMLAALCKLIGARRFFEFGTHRGLTAWTVAHNNPELTVHTLDMPPGHTLQEAEFALDQVEIDFLVDGPERGEAFRDTPEAERIAMLHGDSARFDFSPYRGSMDVIYVDGGHTYEYVKNDTRAALSMLAPGGLIVWDDYPWWPGVYAALSEMAPTMSGELVHLLTTRLVVYSENGLFSS